MGDPNKTKKKKNLDASLLQQFLLFHYFVHGYRVKDHSSIMLNGYMPLTCSANRNSTGKGAAGASRLQLSAHRGEGRVPGLAYIFSEAQARASTQAQTRLHSFHAQRLSGFIHFQDLL